MSIFLKVPEFELGEQYIRLDPREGQYKYRFLLIQKLEIEFLYPLIPEGYEILFSDQSGNKWMTMTKYSIIIHRKYAWDGCTPKRWWGIWWGTPDFERTIMASLIHDCLLQFSQTDHFPLSRLDIDNVFKEVMVKRNFLLSGLYYMGVRLGSRVFKAKYKNVKSQVINSPINIYNRQVENCNC